MTACTGAADAVFGPRVNIACRVFDFTLYFEDAFLACLPAVLFLLISPLELWLLWNETRRVQRSVLLYCKLVSLVVNTSTLNLINEPSVIFKGSSRCSFCVSTRFCSYTTAAVTRVTKQNLATNGCTRAGRYRQRRHPLVYPPLSIDSTLNTAGYLFVGSVATGIGSSQNAMADSRRDQRGDPFYIGLQLHSAFDGNRIHGEKV